MKNLKPLLILLFFSLCHIAVADTVLVCPTCQVSSIKTAIAQASDFDTILIKKGIYKEHDIIVDKPLTIIGEDYPKIDGELKG